MNKTKKTSLIVTAVVLLATSAIAAPNSSFVQEHQAERELVSAVHEAVLRGDGIDAFKLLGDVAGRQDGDGRSQWRYATEVHRLGRRLIEERRYEEARSFAAEAEAALLKAIGLAPSTPQFRAQCLYLLGEVYRGIWRNEKQAAQYFAQAASLDPKNEAVLRAAQRTAKHRDSK